MRRPFVLLGALTLGSGAAMNLMLGQLRSDFFRAYLPPWVYVSYATIAAGGILVVAGLALKPAEFKPLNPSRAAGLMARMALLNAAAAALFLGPVLVPSFRLPILITQWPGIYMVLAYFSFLAVGVLGMAAWSVFLMHLPDLLNRSSVGALGFGVQVVMTEFGVYALAISMFLGGYTGSWLAYTGAGPVAVGAQMEFSVIPSAVSIFMVAAGTFIGVANVFMSGRSVQV
jgi:hypothetical protein